MTRRRTNAEQSGLGLLPQPLAVPPPAPKHRSKPALALVPSPVAAPSTPWGHVAAECPDGRSEAEHEHPFERLAGLLVERWSWVHVRRAAGGPVRCVPGRPVSAQSWDLLEFISGELRRRTVTSWRRAAYEPADGLAYVDTITRAYAAAEDAGRGRGTATKRACGCGPGGLCVAAMELRNRIAERDEYARINPRFVRAVWNRANALTEILFSLHLGGVATVYLNGWRMWWI